MTFRSPFDEPADNPSQAVYHVTIFITKVRGKKAYKDEVKMPLGRFKNYDDAYMYAQRILMKHSVHEKGVI